MTIIEAGWTLMGFGLVGVFVSLILFYFLSKLLVSIGSKQVRKEK